MKIARRLLAAALLSALLVSGCARREAASSRSVWFIAKSTETEFWRSAFAGANAAKAEYSIDLTICGPETEEDYEAQNAYIAQAVQEGAGAIVFSAISYTDNAEAITAAAAQGVKIVVIDSDVDSPGVSVRIGTDNVEAGRMAAAAALDTEEQALVVGIVNYDAGTRNGQEREAGFRESLQEDPRVEKIYTITVLSTQEDAQAQTERLLREHPEINVLVGFNEPVAVGTALAVDAMGLEEKVRMIGFDTNVKCIDLMRTGAVSALIVQNPYAMGYLGVEAAWNLLEGEKYNAQEWLDTTTIIVTKETMFTQESQKALFSFG